MKKRVLISLIVTILLVGILLSQIEINDIAVSLLSVSPLLLLTTFFLYAVSIFLRAFRFKMLLGYDTINTIKLYPISSVHFMLINLLPFRSGELSYIYLIKRKFGVSIGESASTLVVSRVMDFIALSLLFIISIFLIKDVPAVFINALPLVSILTGFLILVFVLLMLYGKKISKLARRISDRTGLTKFNLIKFLMGKIDEVINGLNKIRSKKVLMYSFFISFLIWIINSLLGYMLVKELLHGNDFGLDFWKFVLGVTFYRVSAVIPLQSIGGFGVMEGLFTIGFMSLGLPKEVAISSGFSFHILTLIYSIALGIFGLWQIRNVANKRIS